MQPQSSQSLVAHAAAPAATTPALRTTLRVAAAVTDVRAEPAGGAELVTQALLNVPAEVLETRERWARVRLTDYEGWVASGHLNTCPAPKGQVVVVQAPVANIFAEPAGEICSSKAYATTVLGALSTERAERVQVALPDGSTGWMRHADVAMRTAGAPFPPADPEVAITLARQFLGTPYLWGGTTIAGVDCSGLVQLCCRAAGRIVARDANQQYESIAYVVERGDLRGGDLLYFAHGGAITHVGLMLDSTTYIHAKGRPDSRVMINSLTPDAEGYSEPLAQLFAGARRPFA